MHGTTAALILLALAVLAAWGARAWAALAEAAAHAARVAPAVALPTSLPIFMAVRLPAEGQQLVLALLPCPSLGRRAVMREGNAVHGRTGRGPERGEGPWR